MAISGPQYDLNNKRWFVLVLNDKQQLCKRYLISIQSYYKENKKTPPPRLKVDEQQIIETQVYGVGDPDVTEPPLHMPPLSFFKEAAATAELATINSSSDSNSLMSNSTATSSLLSLNYNQFKDYGKFKQTQKGKGYFKTYYSKPFLSESTKKLLQNTAAKAMGSTFKDMPALEPVPSSYSSESASSANMDAELLDSLTPQNAPPSTPMDYTDEEYSEELVENLKTSYSETESETS